MAYLAYILECINNILNVHKQLTRNKCTLLDCTNTEILMHFIYHSTHLRFGKSCTHSSGTDTHT